MRRALKIVGVIVSLLLVAMARLAIYIYSTALDPRRPVGFQRLSIADPGHTPVVAAVWYPTNAKPGFMLLGTGGLRVATDAPVEGVHVILVQKVTISNMLKYLDKVTCLRAN